MKSALPPPNASEANDPQGELDELRGTSGSDLSAAAERAMGSIDQRRQKREISRIDRDDKMEGHRHLAKVAGLYLITAIGLGMLGSLGWNMAASTAYRFLTDEQESRLQGFLFSGVVGSGLTFVGRQVAGRKEDDPKGD